VKKDGTGASRALSDGSGVLRATKSGSKSALHKLDDPLVALVGQTFGHYHADRLLGRGHSGAVFHATNQKTGQVVALKVLAPEFPAAPADVERFTQELRVATPVRHVNLVGVLGAGKTVTHCWIAREFVEGESAADVIARIASGEKPSWTRAARVVVHLARALDHLHQHRLIHGNITPRNVLLQSSDHATKLADLRLAEILAGSQLQQTVRDKKLLAELPYLAPEQVAKGGFVDSLADLYALGALAHALCTGRPPVTGQSAAEIRDHILNGHVSKPSLVYKKVPAAFDAVVLKLMARNQEDRYQTAPAVLRDLAPIAESHDLKL
jgi:serine/threonine-protein kinase